MMTLKSPYGRWLGVAAAMFRAGRLLRRPFAVVAFALALATPLAAQDVGLPIGTQAPAAAVEALDGSAANLSTYIGKSPVLIEFWATWCPNCKALEPQMQEMATKYGDRVKFIAVAVSVNQSPERVRLYAEKYKLPMTMLYDRTGEATDAYEAPATSYIVILDKAGKVVYTGLGDGQALDAAIRKALP